MVSYDVRVYCETETTYKESNQTTLDENWIPSGCESHTIRDFVIERIVS